MRVKKDSIQLEKGEKKKGNALPFGGEEPTIRHKIHGEEKEKHILHSSPAQRKKKGFPHLVGTKEKKQLLYFYRPVEKKKQFFFLLKKGGGGGGEIFSVNPGGRTS